jgi:hypothetical protein
LAISLDRARDQVWDQINARVGRANARLPLTTTISTKEIIMACESRSELERGSLLHPLLLQPHDSAVLEDLERQRRDERAASIAKRIQRSLLPTEKRCTKITIRPLPFVVFVGQVKAVCVATVYYLTARPRSKTQEQFWFASIEDARTAFPKAQLLDDPQCVAPRLKFASA